VAVGNRDGFFFLAFYFFLFFLVLLRPREPEVLSGSNRTEIHARVRWASYLLISRPMLGAPAPNGEQEAK